MVHSNVFGIETPTRCSASLCCNVNSGVGVHCGSVSVNSDVRVDSDVGGTVV